MSTGWPGKGGSGPVAGTIGIADGTSVGTLRNYRPKGGGVEFVYDPGQAQFVAGRPRTAGLTGSPHQQLARAIGALDERVVGGILRRRADDAFLTAEESGHYGANWNAQVRQQFVAWLEKRTGVRVYHQTWRAK